LRSTILIHICFPLKSVGGKRRVDGYVVWSLTHIS
jgi:hypothetical protein